MPISDGLPGEVEDAARVLMRALALQSEYATRGPNGVAAQ
jgi:transcription initiation factor TFIIIB Brf1 subunit/transcription initiation factor TFIIB